MYGYNCRYYGGYNQDWSLRCIESSLSDLLMVDKPPDLVVSDTVDNTQENLVHEIERHLNLQSPTASLHLVSRLDACTSGLIPVIKSPNVAAIVSKYIADKSVRKVYRVLCQSESPPSLGLLQNWFKKKGKSHANGKPTLLRKYSQIDSSNTTVSANQIHEEWNNWQNAELEILSCEEILEDEIKLDMLILNQASSLFEDDNDGRVDNALRKSSYTVRGNEFSSTSISQKYFECKVHLITGRTHQIRLQFANIGAPIVGDTRYYPVRGLSDEGSTTSWGDGSGLFGPEPKVIGLQCHELTLPKALVDSLQSNPSDSPSSRKTMSSIAMTSRNDGSLAFRSGSPWWRKNDIKSS